MRVHYKRKDQIRMKGFSLHIGVNRLSRHRFKKRVGTLHSPENDARAMAAIAAEKGYENIKVLMGKRATKDAYYHSLHEYASKLKSGDLFLMTYSGHGTKVDDLSGEEKDHKDEAFCLYNDIVIDDDLLHSMEQFEEGVRLVLIMDCCYSEGIIQDLVDAYQKKETRSLPANMRLMAISSARIYQMAFGNKVHGIFTEQLLKSYKESKGNITYLDLFNRVHEKMKVSQKPTYVKHGKPELAIQTAFRI